ncbi:tripartite tricarboxylate transporter TctB family protein [Natronococcus roseus]|uniref:tripartite tricarboxylate transporter TctB family protein n=1 Tax=Natronococcus roseus TaxID=1052014 RepID=UPI00374D46C8
MATTQSDEDEAVGEESAPATAFVALVRLAFPTAALLLALLYVENTYGRIGTENLYYPYFIVALIVVFIGSVYIDEIKYLYNHSADDEFIESIKKSYSEWKRSIGFVIVGAAYISMINVLGFFVSSFLGMVAIMLIGGLRDPKVVVGGTVATLVGVYVLFIAIMGMNPPEGMLI